MSGFSFGVGDVIAVTKMAWSLYHDCFVVARNAPDDFRQLVNELASLQTVLRSLRDDAMANREYLDNLGEARKDSLRRCIMGSHDSLKRVEKLVVKYRKIGNTDDLNFWKRIKWTTHQNEIRDLRNRVMVHSANLNLCMSSMGNSSLARIEKQMAEALRLQESNEVIEDDEENLTMVDSPSLTASKTQPVDDSDVAPEIRVVRSSTEATIPNNAMTTFPSPPLSEDGRSLESLPMSRQRSAPQPGRSRHSASISTVGSSKTVPPSPKTSQDAYADSKATSVTPEPSIASDGNDLMEMKKPVDAAVADALRQLSIARHEEQTRRPLRYPRRDELHQPDDKIKAVLRDLVKDEVEFRRPNARDWLRVATWWLLKARNKMDLHEPLLDPSGPSSGTTSRNSTGIFNQAYVNLLKVSWILYDVFLPNEDLASHLTEENRKLFYDCSHGLSEDLSQLKDADIPSKDELYRQNLNVWEEVQSEELAEDDGLAASADHGRWIAVDHVGAGEEDETVLFRTFVDAVIGPRSRAVRSRGWPYLLILATKEGESEPSVTLCNQSGTLGITRDFKPEDIAEPDSSAHISTGFANRAVGTELIPLDFGELKVKISFSNAEDFSRFMSIPKAYFAAVKEREPRRLANATEALIFRRPVEIFEVLQADTMKPTNPTESYTSCDLRILETTEKEGWRSTRRLVLSSSVGHRKPWSRSYFLPMTRVQLCRESNSRRVKAKWSDCAHLLTKRDGSRLTNGSYSSIYTYVYDENSPNQAMELSFKHQADAREFEQKVLSLSLQPQYEWSTGANQNFVYMMQDSEPNLKEYKGLIVQHTRTHWKYSEFYFMYRDTDYDYNQERLSVWLPSLYYTNYVSTHVDELYAPSPSNPVRFSHCEKKIGNCSLEFENETASQGFMASLTQSHKLLFSRRISYINNKKPSRKLFGQAPWQARGQAELQIWRKGTGYRLLARWVDRNDRDKWISMDLPRTGIDAPQSGSNLIILPSREYERGRKIDMANLISRDPREGYTGRLEAPFTLAFKSYKDREEFVSILNGTPSEDLFGIF